MREASHATFVQASRTGRQGIAARAASPSSKLIDIFYLSYLRAIRLVRLGGGIEPIPNDVARRGNAGASAAENLEARAAAAAWRDASPRVIGA